MTPPQINLALAWTWISLGFLSGLGLGLYFHREGWLGGYASHKRRLLRLAHISFFGLGFVNLGFYLTTQAIGMSGTGLQIASIGFMVGAISMPLCCTVMAYRPKSLLLFSVPVLSLITAGVFTVNCIAKQGHDSGLQATRAERGSQTTLPHVSEGGPL